MFWSSTATRTTVVGVAARIAVLLLVFGLAECAAGSCLSYGHSCWGAHGKRSGNAAATEEVPEDGSEGVAAIASPEDTRWFLSKLVNQMEPGSKNKMWQRLGGLRAGERRPWKSNAAEEEDNDALARSRTLSMQGSEDSPADMLLPSSGEFPGDDNQDGEVLLMTDDQPIRRVPQKLRVYKIMNHPGRKMDK
ncbi:uncharacterized protein CCHa1 [Periplaneta americana]|uniref:uncharacterized protein CCHa1 n=1 Tax=Periplaneta americana TaxID=6978 RepID=UPI0037E709AC